MQQHSTLMINKIADRRYLTSCKLSNTKRGIVSIRLNNFHEKQTNIGHVTCQVYRVVHPTCAPLYLPKYALHEKMLYTKVTFKV